jgi:hypothetical protein
MGFKCGIVGCVALASLSACEQPKARQPVANFASPSEIETPPIAVPTGHPKFACSYASGKIAIVFPVTPHATEVGMSNEKSQFALLNEDDLPNLVGITANDLELIINTNTLMVDYDYDGKTPTTPAFAIPGKYQIYVSENMSTEFDNMDHLQSCEVTIPANAH